MDIAQDPYCLLKENYLNRYNINRSDIRAIDCGIIAAVQRNPTYTKALTEKEKTEIRNKWKTMIKDIGKKYKQSQDVQQFKKDIEELKIRMNAAFPNAFNNMKYDNELRLSHAQKSLSVYLKHLWCMGIIPEPPICPIDRIVLTRVGLRGRTASWGIINRMDIYEKKLETVLNKANESNLSIARWELLNF